MDSRIRINILLNLSMVSLIRQLPPYLRKQGFDFYENSQLDIVWDMVVMFEGMPQIQRIKCKQGGLIYISAEPPNSRRYASRFLSQFDHIISTHPKINHASNHLSQPAVDWWFGRNYKPVRYNYQFEQLEHLPLPNKTHKISFIASNQSNMPGHIKRLKFLAAVKNAFGDQIDYYGYGFNLVQDKADALLPYMFSVCIENSSIPHYWTEKLADPLLGYTIPVYAGCLNIDAYFPADSHLKIDVNDIPNSLKTIGALIANSNQIYQNKLPALLESRKKLLHEYNMFGVLKRFYEEKVASDMQEKYVNEKRLHPPQYFFETAIINKLLKQKNFLKRLRYKIMYKLKLISY